jgi:Fe-S-cluster containining protein
MTGGMFHVEQRRVVKRDVSRETISRPVLNKRDTAPPTSIWKGIRLMTIDLRPFFNKYETVVKTVDQAFEQVKAQHPQEVKCFEGCSDCCHALFDLSLIEALYINHHFNERFTGPEREALLEVANRADRQVYQIKRRAYKDLESGRSEDDIIAEMATERVRCPLLNEQDRCVLYEQRPITCRFYGIPTAIGGKGRTCGLSGFAPGRKYPTVNLDAIHKQLYLLSEEVVRHIRSKFIRMAEVLVPLSMALITDYNDEQLGVGLPDNEDKVEGGRGGGGNDE